MNLRVIFYKVLNKLCDSDITRALHLDTQTFVPPPCNPDVQCRVLDTNAIDQLVGQFDAPVNQAFADDFRRNSFVAIGAYVGDELAGLSFYAAGKIHPRHNCGGARFNGIGLELPPRVRYQFKVSVMQAQRGRQLNAAMNACAIDYWGIDKVTTIITTTDWTNSAYLKSSYRQGFVRYGSAAEFVLAGRHLYLLPKPYEPMAEKLPATHRNAEVEALATTVRFIKG